MGKKRPSRPDKIQLCAVKGIKAAMYFFRCKDGDNGETRWVTETYTRKSTARSLALKYARKHSNYRVYDFGGKLIFPKP